MHVRLRAAVTREVKQGRLLFTGLCKTLNPPIQASAFLFPKSGQKGRVASGTRHPAWVMPNQTCGSKNLISILGCWGAVIQWNWRLYRGNPKPREIRRRRHYAHKVLMNISWVVTLCIVLDTHHSLPVGRLEKQPLNVQSGVITHPELMVAGQRGIVSDNLFHLCLSTCRKHTQQNCRETSQSQIIVHCIRY